MPAHILVVEDNADNRKLVVRMLAQEGFHGEAVESAEEALVRLEQRRFDLVLMDVRLPRMDGKEATRRLRQDPRFRDLPIIAVSAHVVGKQHEEILASGVSALVTKPIDMDELLGAIRRLLPADAKPGLVIEAGN
ncbi:MAG: response regulator [Candidatus Binatia bacterium]